ncbi:MAG TPA: lysine--tRNA ligase, partial [Candidatus Saccharimonadales bacterium]
VEYVRASERYRSGWYVPAIEKALEHVADAKKALETISGRKLDEHWTPTQILEDGRLKNRQFVSIDTGAKTVTYIGGDGQQHRAAYDKGEVKLDWRLDWPGRWWLLDVQCEPSGRDHMTKGSSYDTGIQIVKGVYGGEAPYPVAYDFINLAGDTKKMSASKGTGIDAVEGSQLMPPEVVRYFVLGSPPAKRLYFDPAASVVQLMDEYAALLAKPDKTPDDEQLIYICSRGEDAKTVSRVPFSHLVASYQAALHDTDKTLDIIARTEYADIAGRDADIIKNELRFIGTWLDKRAPENVRFSLLQSVDAASFTQQEQSFFTLLGDKIAEAPADADGAWFHNAVYGCRDEAGLAPKDMFQALYRLLIGKTHGPRAGWFLSILPRDWLTARLKLEK